MCVCVRLCVRLCACLCSPLPLTTDYSKDGWAVSPVAGQPKFSGDYFLPGSPLEGWSIEYKTSVAGTENRGIGKQQVGHTVPVTSVSDTSVDGRLSAVWVGLYGVLKISKSTSFGVDDLFFTTTVTLQNTGTTVLYEVDYMRNVDPDQEQVRTACGCAVVCRYGDLTLCTSLP